MKQLKRILARTYRNYRFKSSRYWEERYRSGGNSGAGSYGIMCRYKADVINQLVENYNIESIIDYGCGDGNQALSLKVKSYLGIDVSEEAIRICKEKFEGIDNRYFLHVDDLNGQEKSDMVLSMDVLYHLIEDEVFEAYLSTLFTMASKLVVIFSTNFNRINTIHHRDREFLNYVNGNFANWNLVRSIENPHKGNDSEADFYIFEKTN